MAVAVLLAIAASLIIGIYMFINFAIFSRPPRRKIPFVYTPLSD